MKTTAPATDIALVDDGELEDVARLLEASGIPFTRHRGGQIADSIASPRSLLIVTARRLEHVVPPRRRRGALRSPRRGHRGAPGRADETASAELSAEAEPLRIVAVSEDSPALRRRLRRQGMQLLVRLPAQRETWRLLIARALHQGEERRTDVRVAPDVPVEADQGGAMLVDLSNRGCRIQTGAPLRVGDTVQLSIPAASLPQDGGGSLRLSGQVRRIAQLEGSDRRTCAVVFDPDLALATRQRLTAAINHWASGDPQGARAAVPDGPRIPACRLPSLPDLMLDDETDPPIRARQDVSIELDRPPLATASPQDRTAARPEPHAASDRRSGPRGHFPSVVRASQGDRPIAFVGRDLSARGMRIERHPDLALGDRFRLALHGPTLARPITLDAAVVRDDADEGLALAFIGVSRETARTLEKLVACLPDVESLEEGEVAGLGTVLSEIIPD
ncbi:MAG: PilZ domain-containing protein [Myxococcota bacterium]